MNAPTVYIETHGCKLNEADTQAISRRFLEAGYGLSSRPDHASVHVVNTCTVTHVADGKARQALRRAKRLNPRSLVVATGCYAQRAPDELDRLDGVDVVLGNTEKDALVEEVSQLLDFYRADSPGLDTIDEERAPVLLSRAMIKIQEGCNQVCAYCIVPKVRGRERSIPPQTLVSQVNDLVRQGYREVVLTGTQLGSYGFDIPGASLTGMLRRLLDETAIPRLRVSSLQPQEITDELLELWQDERFCPHFHLPLQSGSEAVLKQMRRRYSPGRYLEAVRMVRNAVPHAAVTADVIAGFPSETVEQFQDTYDLCSEVGFAAIHVFPYSARPGTTAAYLKPKVDSKEVRRRIEIMLDLAKRQAKSYRKSLLGTRSTVLWESGKPLGNTQVWSGLTGNYVRVATASSEHLRNRITPVVLEQLNGRTVWARLA